MKINILFFAGIREMFGFKEKNIKIEESINSPEKLVKFLIEKEQGSWIKLLSSKDLIRVAINQEISEWSSPLKDGDELAFFPPITGG
ncbi:molybdopterin converting factor subunit 1 [Methylophilaceae bacterium]|mgnify:CR=1 FL=1|jgi:molybdopterin synthase sulfur carrier subunit|nr:molybdopterin converting factor subunit 1 [Methylophilaceae bacterium]|tara:strand:- start:5705 stop:5965 length:261 start_codon:yes stop_codon:yes gene_type:complete